MLVSSNTSAHVFPLQHRSWWFLVCFVVLGLFCVPQGIDFFISMHLDGSGVNNCDHWHDNAGIMSHRLQPAVRASAAAHRPIRRYPLLREDNIECK